MDAYALRNSFSMTCGGKFSMFNIKPGRLVKFKLKTTMKSVGNLFCVLIMLVLTVQIDFPVRSDLVQPTDALVENYWMETFVGSR